MAEYLLQVYHGGKIYEPPVEGGVSWETSRKGTPGKLQFTVLDSGLPVEEGDTVNFSAGGRGLFYGFVFTLSRNGADGRLSITAYDQLRYLKNKDNYIYSNKTAGELLKMIAEDFSLKTGAIAATGYNIPYRVEDGKTLFDIIETALDLTYENTGREFVLYDDFGKLCLKPYESLLLPLYIDEDTAQGYSYTSSIDSDVYNRIKLAWDNDETGVREVHVMNNTASQSKWGTLQYYEKLDNALNTADLQTKAKALMKYYNVIHRELTMQKVFGDVRARAGTSVCVGMGLGDINIKNYMCVEKAKHTFSNGLYTMDLYLSGIRGEFSA